MKTKKQRNKKQNKITWIVGNEWVWKGDKIRDTKEEISLDCRFVDGKYLIGFSECKSCDYYQIVINKLTSDEPKYDNTYSNDYLMKPTLNSFNYFNKYYYKPGKTYELKTFQGFNAINHIVVLGFSDEISNNVPIAKSKAVDFQGTFFLFLFFLFCLIVFFYFFDFKHTITIIINLQKINNQQTIDAVANGYFYELLPMLIGVGVACFVVGIIAWPIRDKLCDKIEKCIKKNEETSHTDDIIDTNTIDI